MRAIVKQFAIFFGLSLSLGQLWAAEAVSSLEDAERYYIKTFDGRFVALSSTGRLILTPEGDGTAREAFQANRLREHLWTLRLAEDRRFLGAAPDKTVALSESVGTWEPFDIRGSDGVFTARSVQYGTYLSTHLEHEGDTNALFMSDSASNWEQLRFVKAAPLQIKQLYSWSNADLLTLAREPLLAVSAELKAGHSEINKANIFRAGLTRLERAVSETKGETELHSEMISVYTSVGFSSPFKQSVQEAPKPTVLYDEKWMDYTTRADAGFSLTFANFANHRLGGGWRGHGNTQEEQMVQQCPAFALVLALLNPSWDNIKLHTRRDIRFPDNRESPKFASEDSASPILFKNMRCLQKLRGEYETDIGRLWRFTWNMEDALADVPDAPAANMIALAAPELTHFEKGALYNKTLVRDMFNNAFTAYTMVKQHDAWLGKKTMLVLGRWGAGAFGHNVYMSVAMQYLAARLSLAGTDRVLFTGFTEAQAREAIEVVDAKIVHFFEREGPAEAVIIDAVLASILDESHTRGWRTR